MTPDVAKGPAMSAAAYTDLSVLHGGLHCEPDPHAAQVSHCAAHACMRTCMEHARMPPTHAWKLLRHVSCSTGGTGDMASQPRHRSIIPTSSMHTHIPSRACHFVGKSDGPCDAPRCTNRRVIFERNPVSAGVHSMSVGLSNLTLPQPPVGINSRQQ
eukprot:362997-Chlamydomonas_euryale.AAC.5